MSSTSASLFAESSNPGVSTSTTSFPSSMNGLESSILSVHEARLSLTRKSEPLARLMNYAVVSTVKGKGFPDI